MKTLSSASFFFGDPWIQQIQFDFDSIWQAISLMWWNCPMKNCPITAAPIFGDSQVTTNCIAVCMSVYQMVRANALVHQLERIR
jgi:hypothetical protein